MFFFTLVTMICLKTNATMSNKIQYKMYLMQLKEMQQKREKRMLYMNHSLHMIKIKMVMT